MPKNLVAKFGGTSVKDPDSIQKVFHIVKSNPEIRIVVVSAIGEVTDLLLDYSYATKIKKKRYIDRIRDIHINIVKGLGLDDLEHIINNRLLSLLTYDELENLDPKSIDRVLSLGEDLSSLIISRFFYMNDLPSQFFDIRNLLRTNSDYGQALPILSKIQENLCLLPEGLIVTQGFIGSDLQGNTTTLGRGGSDYSAALLAEALKSEELLIYTDVSGVYSIDPFIDAQAKLISRISFYKMKEMATLGAEILHLSTLEPCLRSKTVIKILSTFNPYSKHTLITFNDFSSETTNEVLAITLKPEQIFVSIKEDRRKDNYNVLDKVFSLFSKYNIITQFLTVTKIETSFVIDNFNSKCSSFISNTKLVNELNLFSEIFIEENLTLIAIIGQGLISKKILQTVLEVLNNVIIRFVYYKVNNSSLGILIDSQKAEEIARVLHQKLIINFTG